MKLHRGSETTEYTFVTFLFVLFGIVLSVAIFFAYPVYAEEIISFDSDIELATDGSFIVTETIEFNFGGDERRGIFREIPKVHPQDSRRLLKTRYFNIELIDVTHNGNKAPILVEDDGNLFHLRIGDPDITFNGLQTYKIVYRVDGGLSYFNDGTVEINWSTTGTNWDVPIREATAQLRASEDIFLADSVCYRGSYNSNERCEHQVISPSLATFSTQSLLASEGMTIAQALDASKVKTVVFERTNMLVILAGLGFIVLIVLAYVLYRYLTYHKTGRSVIPQYEPYKNIKPMYTGVLFDGKLDPKDITAGIVYLAELGFIKIKKTEKKVLFFFEVDDYEITLTKPIYDAPTVFLQDVLTLLFSGMSNIKTPVLLMKFRTYLQHISSSETTEKNVSIGAQVTLSELKKNMSKQRQNFKIIQKLKEDIRDDLVEMGFYERPLGFSLGWVAYTTIAVVVIILGQLLFQFFGVSGIIFLLIIIGAVVIAKFASRRRTRKGYEALDHLKGFKEFLSVTGKDRFAFHNAPEKNPQQFLEYLPYAIAFGVEKKWAEVFEGITIPDPNWYEGSAGAHFSAAGLTTSLGAFSTTFASSSGSSGSSGGGSVGGGGGGGGGGGSW